MVPFQEYEFDIVNSSILRLYNHPPEVSLVPSVPSFSCAVILAYKRLRSLTSWWSGSQVKHHPRYQCWLRNRDFATVLNFIDYKDLQKVDQVFLYSERDQSLCIDRGQE